MTKSPGSFVKLSNTALVYEHTLQRFCVKLILEPFTFTQEQVVNIESTIMKRFVVALSFGNDQISRFKCLTGFAADMGKPGAADFISISDYGGQFGKPYILCIFHCRIIDYRKTSDDHGDIEFRTEFFKKYDNQFVKNDFSSVISQIDKAGGSA